MCKSSQPLADCLYGGTCERRQEVSLGVRMLTFTTDCERRRPHDRPCPLVLCASTTACSDRDSQLADRHRCSPSPRTNPRSFCGDCWRYVYAGQLEVRPPSAPTTGMGEGSTSAGRQRLIALRWVARVRFLHITASLATCGDRSHYEDGVAGRVQQVECARAPVLLLRRAQNRHPGAPLAVVGIRIIHLEGYTGVSTVAIHRAIQRQPDRSTLETE